MRLSKTVTLREHEAKLQIIVTDDARGELNKLFRKYNTAMVYKDNIAGYMLTVAMNMYHLILDSRYLSHNLIAHENFHLVMGITTDRNIFEEEPRAIIAGHTSQIIYDFLKSKGIQINNE